MPRIILASASPRRRELLGRIYSEFEIEASSADEELPEGMHPRDGVELLAVRKGRDVADRLGDEPLIISSDTLVELGGTALGKPVDASDAFRMLRLLSGECHNVHTGVAVHYRGRVYSGRDTARVKFRTLSDDEITDYIAGGEPMDKAGSYAIQGEGGKFIEYYDGGFDTIMGLSLDLTVALIHEALED